MQRACLPLLLLVTLYGATPYTSQIEAWRQEREQKLKASDGWLSVAGLYWLKEGENRAGSDPSYEIVLPAGRVPKRIGIIDLHGSRVSFRIAHEAHVLLNGKSVREAELKPDVDK